MRFSIFEWMTFEGHIEELQHPSEKMGESSCLHSKISKYHCERASSYSLKVVLNGTEHYQIDGNSYRLNSGQMLVVNKDEDLRALVDTKDITEGICIYPPQALIDEVIYSKLHSEAYVLENPISDWNEQHLTTQSFQLTSDKHLAKTLSKYWSHLWTSEEKHADWWWQFYAELADSMVMDQSAINRQLKGLASIKKHTKEELYRRVYAAAEFINDHKFEKLDVDTLASISSLSKFHFLRSFKSIFGLSPYQYALHLKLVAAQRLVDQGSSYSEAAIRVGYSDPKNLRKALLARA